jgi:hypothetical protein
MIAHLAFLTTPAPGVFILNIQAAGNAETYQFEISKAHLANIVIDATAVVLREASTAFPQTKERRVT